MPGSLVRDASAPVLAAAATIDSNTTTTGSAVRVGFPGLVQVELVSGAITDGTYGVAIESSWDSAFTSPIEVGRFEALDPADDSETKAQTIYVDAPYLRAVIVSLSVTTGGVIGPITVREPHLDRVTSGPGHPTGPATGTGYPNSSND